MNTLNHIFKFCFYGFLLILFSASNSKSQETIYPGGTNISINYLTSETNIRFGDTLILTRTITNNESYSLSNLYLSENLPPELNLDSFSLKISGADIPTNYIGPLEDEVEPGYFTSYWMIDDPSPEDTLNRLLAPGETLTLEYFITCSAVGVYLLPFHTTCYYGNGTSFFAIGNSVELTFTIEPSCGDVDSDGDLNILDVIFIINFKYKDGPPPEEMWVIDINNDGGINILDVIYLINFMYKDGPELLCTEPAK